MTLHVYDFEQGTPEWHDARRGIVTASVVGKLITPALKVADNDTSRAVTLQLIAERITGFTDPTYVSADMERGNLDEPIARKAYNDNIAEVVECGFMVEDAWGYRIGYSPDGLVATGGLIEIKSRLQKKQLQTILTDQVPVDNMAQLQTGLLVSGREWIDYVSYCAGMLLYTKRIYPDPFWFGVIGSAVRAFEDEAARITDIYRERIVDMPPTERTVEVFEEMRF